MVVHMPGGGEVVVDAKVPLDAFLQLIDADDDEREALSARPSTPGSCAPTSTSWPRRSTGSSSTGRPRWSSPSSPATSCSPRPSRPIRRCRSTPWPTASLLTTPDHADRPAAHGGPGLATGDAGRERPRGPEAGRRALRAPPRHDGPHADAAAQPHLERRGVQQGRRILRVPRPRLGPPVPRARGRGYGVGRRSPSSRRSRRRRATCRPWRPTTRTTSSTRSTILALPEGGAYHRHPGASSPTSLTVVCRAAGGDPPTRNLV